MNEIDKLFGTYGYKYCKIENERLTKIPFLEFIGLPSEEKEKAILYLEKKIKKLNPPDNDVRKILEIRNVVYYSLLATALPVIPGTVLKELIFDRLTPKDIRSARGVNRHWRNCATHSVMIRSINKGVSLMAALPPKLRTAKRALDWLKQDLNACAQLRFASWARFSDITDENIAELARVCPNIVYLCIYPKKMTKITTLPLLLQELRLYDGILTSLPELPQSLKKLTLWNVKVTTLPKLPASLQELEILNCYSLSSLPKFPASLLELVLNSCHKVTTLPELPAGLQKLTYLGPGLQGVSIERLRQFKNRPS